MEGRLYEDIAQRTDGAVLIGVVAVLIQRLREIEGGEEDEAKKY